MKQLFAALFIGLCVSSAASAAPFNPDVVSKQAKFVAHVDYEALSEMELVEHFREQRPEMVRRIRQWMVDRYGINPQEDIKGMTIYGNAYEHDTGILILSADYDRQKVIEHMQDQRDLKTTQWNDHTFYSYAIHRKHSHHEKSDRDASGNEHDKRVTTVLVDDATIVFAASEKQAKTGVEVLIGETPSLKGAESKFMKSDREGAVIYGAAVELDSISNDEGILPILQQHERVEYAFGEHDGELFENVRLVAQNKKVAKQMKKALEGFVALARVWSGASEDLSKLYDEVEIERDGKTVHANWEGETDVVIDALDDVQKRMSMWRSSKRK